MGTYQRSKYWEVSEKQDIYMCILFALYTMFVPQKLLCSDYSVAEISKNIH